MTILILQSLLLLLVAFIVGCLLGCVFRRFLSKEAAAERGVPAPPLSSSRSAAPARRAESKPAVRPEPAPTPSVVVPEPYVFTADRTDQAVTLSGRMSSASDRDRLLGIARARFADLVVDDRLSVGGDAPKRVDWPAATAFALDQLAGLASGRVRLQDDVLSLSGTAVNETAGEEIGKVVRGDLPAGLTLGTFDLKRPEPVSEDQPQQDEDTGDEAATDVAETDVDAETLEAPGAETTVSDDLPASDHAPVTSTELGPDTAATDVAETDRSDAGSDEPEMKPLEIDAPEGLSGQQPAGYAAARDGQADDLKRIKGIGKVNEQKLNALGVWHLDQIAAWTDKEIAWVDGYLAFKGRIDREDWVGQAKALTEGDRGKSES